VDHTHVVAGGGKQSHSHDVSSGDNSHSHGPQTADNPTDKNLLPFMNKLAERKPQASDGALIALGSDVKLGEGRVPFLKTGNFEFSDYGNLDVDRDSLVSAKRVFDERVRQQDWPVFFRGAIDEFAGANEDHNPTRAVGWMRGLEFRDDDHLDAIVDFNPVGDKLLANDQYRYSSAEMLRNWKDERTGTVYPLVPYGIALTNTPRIKGMGEILCSENGEAQLLAFSEGPITAASASMAHTLLLADGTNDPDHDGDDDGPVPPCVFQPGYGSCPGFTRWPGDADGDGVCLMATKGCNGYRAISGTTSPLPYSTSMYSESSQGGPMTDTAAGTAPEKAATDAAVTDTSTEKKVTQPNADSAEDKNILASERSAREAAQTKLSEMEGRVKTLEAQAKLAAVDERLDKAVREFRLTPAQKEIYSEHMVALSEDNMGWLLSEIEAREVIPALGKEKGVAGNDTTLDESARLDQAAKAHMSEQGKAGTKLTYKQALLHVSGTGFGRA
jgi:phage I-like protein